MSTRVHSPSYRRTLFLVLGFAVARLEPTLFANAKPGETDRAATDPGENAEWSVVSKWEPHDFSFRSTSLPENPFGVAFSADVISPSGIKLTLPGFYDGGRTWKVRVSATETGDWSLTTHASLPELDRKTARFSCRPANLSRHGAIKVDTLHPSHFVFEDGTRWFPMGYECDWLWALDEKDDALPTVNAFLDRIVSNGFTFVLLNAYAYDTTWRKGNANADDFGPSRRYAWLGTNDAPDHTRLNLPYWQHYDQVIDALYRHGLVAHVYFKVYNKLVNWPKAGSPEDDLFFRWVIARYSAYPNITWDMSKEWQNEHSLAYKLGRIAYVHTTDPYHRLLTVHDDRAVYDAGHYATLLDYRSVQEQKSLHALTQKDLAQRPWPVINVEFGYEWGARGPSDKTYNVVQSPEEVIRRAWEISMAGGYIAYYYTYTGWDVIRPNDVPPGYVYFKNLRTFFESTQYWLLRPSDGSVTAAGNCLANPGVEYVIYHAAKTSFQLNVANATGTLSSEWFDPLSGRRVPGPAVKNGTNALTPPGVFGAGPLMLHISANL